METLFGQQAMKKRDLERKVNKSRYEQHLGIGNFKTS